MVNPRPSQQAIPSAGWQRGHRQYIDTVATGFRQVLKLSIPAILTAASTIGCGGTDSDEYEAVTASDIASSLQASSPSGSPAGAAGHKTAVIMAVPERTTDSSSDSSPDTATAELPVPARTDSDSFGSDSVGSESGTSTVDGQTGNGDSGTTAADGPAPGETVQPQQSEPVTKPLEVKLLIPEKKFRKEGREKALRVSFDDIDLLKVLNMDPVQADAPELMPDWLKGLEGRQIRIRGFMYPTFQDTDIKVFILARDNQICCFGRSPKVYDLIKISMQNGRTTDYIPNRPFDLVGTFHIAEQAETAEDALPRLYSIDDAVIIDR
ncbi:MAG: hypothetical protein VB858_09095 [Planctomycetaceae bacterium]